MAADRLKASAKAEAVGSLWDSSIRWEIDEEASTNPKPVINWWRILSVKKGSPYPSWPDGEPYTIDEPGLLVVRIYGDGPFSVEVDSPEIVGGAKAVPVTGPPFVWYTRQSPVTTFSRITTTEAVPSERVEWRGDASKTTQSKPDGAVTVQYQTTMRGADGSDATITEMEPGVWVADKEAYGTMLVSYSRRVHLLTVSYQYFPESWDMEQIEARLAEIVDGEMVVFESPDPDLSKSVPLWWKVDYAKLNDYPLVILVRDETRPENQDIILADRWRQSQSSSSGKTRASSSDDAVDDGGLTGLPDILTEVERNNETKTVTFSAPVTSTTVEYIKDITFEYETGAIDPETEQPVKKQIKFVYEVA